MATSKVSRLARMAGLAIVLGGSAAGAGPWPREPGHHFLSFSHERDREGNSYSGLYGEYGFRPRTTLGYELGHTNVGETTALLWIQRALDDGEGPNRFAVSAGVGGVRTDQGWLGIGQVGASWGRGFEGLWGGGWMTAEARIRIAGSVDAVAAGLGLGDAASAYLTPETSAKLDMTLGFRPAERLMVVNQLRLEQRPDADFSAKLALSVIGDVGGPAKIELGVIQPLTGPGEPALKLGSWVEF